MSDIRFNQWLHQSGTGGVSQVASGAVGVGTTNPLADFYVRGDAQITGILTAGHIAMGSSITFGDDDRAYFGDGTDMQLYHNGTNSYIENGTNALNIKSYQTFLQNASGSEDYLKATDGYGVELYHNNNKRIETTGLGVTVFGTTQTQQLNVSGISTFNDDVNVVTGKKINFGNANGTTGHVYYDGSTTRFQTNSGLNIGSPVISLKSANLAAVMGEFVATGSVKLFYDYANNNDPKFQTTGYGATVFGQLDTTNLSISGITTVGKVNQTLYSPHTTSWATRSAITLFGNYGGGIAFNDNNNNGWVQHVSGSGVDFWLKNGAVGGALATSIKATKGGSVELYENGSKKIETTTAGVHVTGSLNVTTTMHIPDGSVGLQFGNSNDMIMYHNGSNSHIQHLGTGGLYIDSLNNSADIILRSQDNINMYTNAASQSAIDCVGNGGVILYNQGNARFNTDSDGAVVTEKRLAINRNAGDPYLQFQTSGTTHATLYGGASTGFRVFTTPSGGSSTERLRVTNDGNIGFNRTNVNAGDSATQLATATPNRFVFNNHYSNGYTDNSLKLYLFNDGATRQGFTSGPLYDLQYHSSGHATHAKHSFFTQNVERLRITADGKVGIGDDNPDYILHLKSNVPAICFEDTDGTHGQCIIEQNSDNLKIRCDAGNASSGYDSNIRFEVDGSEKVRIKSDGSLIAKGVRGVTVHNVSTADVEIGGRHIWNRIESTNHESTSGAQQIKIKFFRSSSSNSVTCYYKGVVVNVTASGRYDWGGHGYVTHSSSTILMFSSTTGGSHRHVHNEGYNHINNTANGVNHKISGVVYSYDSNYLYATFSFDTNISGTGFKPYYNIEIIDPSQCTYDVEGI